VDRQTIATDGGDGVTDTLVPGEVLLADEAVQINEGRETAIVQVGNTGDRPIQVGSHLHFFEANPALRFDRRAAFGMRLDIPAGTAVRFEPGEVATVDLVAIGGERRVTGVNGLVDGSVDGSSDEALERAHEEGFGDTGRGDDAPEEASNP
jgi:urease subunit beta